MAPGKKNRNLFAPPPPLPGGWDLPTYPLQVTEKKTHCGNDLSSAAGVDVSRHGKQQTIFTGTLSQWYLITLLSSGPFSANQALGCLQPRLFFTHGGELNSSTAGKRPSPPPGMGLYCEPPPKLPRVAPSFGPVAGVRGMASGICRLWPQPPAPPSAHCACA